jgi:hypothetical protein
MGDEPERGLDDEVPAVERTAWLPPEFVHPERAALSTWHHLRPIRASDVDIDYPAVMTSRERLWAIFGRARG